MRRIESGGLCATTRADARLAAQARGHVAGGTRTAAIETTGAAVRPFASGAAGVLEADPA